MDKLGGMRLDEDSLRMLYVIVEDWLSGRVRRIEDLYKATNLDRRKGKGGSVLNKLERKRLIACKRSRIKRKWCMPTVRGLITLLASEKYHIKVLEKLSEVSMYNSRIRYITMTILEILDTIGDPEKINSVIEAIRNNIINNIDIMQVMTIQPSLFGLAKNPLLLNEVKKLAYLFSNLDEVEKFRSEVGELAQRYGKDAVLKVGANILIDAAKSDPLVSAFQDWFAFELFSYGYFESTYGTYFGGTIMGMKFKDFLAKLKEELSEINEQS